MSILMWFLLTATAIGVMVFSFFKRFAEDRLDALTARLHGAGRLISRGHLVDGGHRREVALALTDMSFIYESARGQTTFDRTWLQTVEYENRLSSGKSVGHERVLRVRCFSREIEFVLSQEVVREWESILPAHCLLPART